MADSFLGWKVLWHRRLVLRIRAVFQRRIYSQKCPFHHCFPRHCFHPHPLPLQLVQTQYRRQQLKIPRQIQSSSATGVCAGGMAFGSVGAVRDVKQVILALAIRLLLAPRGPVQEGWLSGAIGRRDVKACQFSISNQALLFSRAETRRSNFHLEKKWLRASVSPCMHRSFFQNDLKVTSIRTSRSTLTRWLFDAEEWREILTDIYANFESNIYFSFFALYFFLVQLLLIVF